MQRLLVFCCGIILAAISLEIGASSFAAERPVRTCYAQVSSDLHASAFKCPEHKNVPAPPAQADRAGSVVVLMEVTEAGIVGHASVLTSSGYPELDKAALATALTNTFAPGSIDGIPNTMLYAMTYQWFGGGRVQVSL